LRSSYGDIIATEVKVEIVKKKKNKKSPGYYKMRA
jgi:hypothetical protein